MRAALPIVLNADVLAPALRRRARQRAEARPLDRLALRQPALACALGLFYDLTIPVPDANLLQGGGWLMFEFNPAEPVQPKGIDTLRRYAARLPALAAGAAARPLFAALVFPVGKTGASYDDALVEAAVYDDGFAKIMHAAQAVNADAATDGHNRLRLRAFMLDRHDEGLETLAQDFQRHCVA